MSFDVIYENDNIDKIFVYFCVDKNVSKVFMKMYVFFCFGEVMYGLMVMC